MGGDGPVGSNGFGVLALSQRVTYKYEKEFIMDSKLSRSQASSK